MENTGSTTYVQCWEWLPSSELVGVFTSGRLSFDSLANCYVCVGLCLSLHVIKLIYLSCGAENQGLIY